MKLFTILCKQTLQNQMSLKDFMRRQQILKLYRDLMKTARQVDDPYYRKEIQDWIRRDFRTYQHLTDVSAINIYITYGKKCLKELENSIALAK